MPEDTIDWIIVVDKYCNIPLKKKSCQSLFCSDNTCKPIQYWLVNYWLGIFKL